VHGGIDHPLAGYTAFCAVKFAGYTLAALPIRALYKSVKRNLFAVGGARTAIGMTAGAACYLGFAFAGDAFGIHPASWFYVGLIPIRIAEWWLLVWLFFDRKLDNRNSGWVVAGAGTVWSYILDLPAAFGFFTVGGVWVC
jgi:hypothetical protein